ncbi:MAG: hypothetical protein O7G85_00375 [Planctomycetota bacterium]|nr:hypothetical protein [Planctomycetota bacterium]
MQQDQSKPARRSRFFAIMTALLLLFVFAGFARTFFLRAFFDVPEMPGYLYVHGFLLTAWFALLFTQTCLIAKNRVSVHQRLGMFGVVLALGVVAISVWVLVRRDFPTIEEEPNRAFGNLVTLIGFSLCVLSGVLLRRRPAAHKRLMLLASVSILAPALDRMVRPQPINEFLDPFLPDALGPPEIGFAVMATLSMILSVVIHDLLSRKRLHWATIWGVLCFLVLAPATSAALTNSGAWSAFVRWAG